LRSAARVTCTQRHGALIAVGLRPQTRAAYGRDMDRVAARFLVVVCAGAACHGPATHEQPAGGADATTDDAGTTLDAASPDAPVTFACAPTRTAGHQEIDCPEGVHMDVEVSAACVAGGCGIIFDVHGFTMTADQLDTHTRMRVLAPPLGYIVVQPTASGLWGSRDHDDVIWEFARATAAVLHTDADRLYFMGFSQGAILTFHMLCAHADAIAAIAPDSGNGCFGAAGVPSAQRPVLYMQGTADNIQPWSTFGPPVRDAILGTWDFGAPTPLRSGSKFVATEWTTSAGTTFEFWQHDYRAGDFLGGHCLPVPAGAGTYKCSNAELDYSTEVLRFFQAHPRAQQIVITDLPRE
jgi:poly(3-hydroxybutyrate) depolymerase